MSRLYRLSSKKINVVKNFKKKMDRKINRLKSLRKDVIKVRIHKKASHLRNHAKTLTIKSKLNKQLYKKEGAARKVIRVKKAYKKKKEKNF